ncbi:MAG TPA: hypothetical protein VGL17_07870 [Gemmatimonadaceae bacterium]
MARTKKEALPTTSTEIRRSQLIPAMVVRIKRLRPLTRSPQPDRHALRLLLLPREYKHLLGQSQSSAGGCSLRRAAP